MEHIISFGGTFDDQDRPFYIEMAGITYPDPNYHITRKNSYIHCFEYVIRGSGIVTVDGVTSYPSEGDLYVLPKGADHDYRSTPEDPFEKIWFNISGTLCDELIHVYGITGTLIVKGIEAFPIFREFLDICENKELALNEIHSQCALVFHRLIIKIHDSIIPDSDHNSKGAAFEVKSYIDRNIYERLSIESLSKHVNISSSQVNRVFKKAYGVTPYDYILTRKIETAKLLLKNSSLTVKEIAYRLNFADEHYSLIYSCKKPGYAQKSIKSKP